MEGESVKSSLSGLDFWRLSDKLSVIDASFLTLMCDPGHFRLENPMLPMASEIRQLGGFDLYTSSGGVVQDLEYAVIETHVLEGGGVGIDPARFRAVFKALRNAIVADKLEARIVTLGRSPSYAWHPDFGHAPEEYDDGEDARHYGFAVSQGAPTVYSNCDSILSAEKPESERKVYILKEPDWSQTTIDLETLKAWFRSRGIAPKFFFPEGVAEGFRDRLHPRYAPKLATAVAAWENVKRQGKNKSAKQTLIDWIISNGIRFGLGSDDATVSQTVAEEVAKIANWHPGGGANPTYTEVDEAEDEVTRAPQNFSQVQPVSSDKVARGRTVDRDLDGEIPF